MSKDQEDCDADCDDT
jgi:hypothetical protein